MSELVVLLDDDGRAVGTAAKSEVHHGETPRHLAFSAYLFDPDGALLLTRRSAAKLTFPGLWTNSVCGHPSPGEALPAAVRRRARDELGTRVEGLRLVLPQFSYVARMAGIVENEWCPVYAGLLADRALAVNPHEVDDTEWVDWPALAAQVLAGRRAVSPWCREQVALLWQLGPDPASWVAADADLLPPAARVGTSG
jgi:isopentenyl-diphosphate delta-isomerase